MWVQEAREVKGPKGNTLVYLYLIDHLGRAYYALHKGAAGTLLRGRVRLFPHSITIDTYII
jgi:hypothetical protein